MAIANAPFAPVVTISATYGAAGSVIAPQLAESLGLPFVDRLLNPDSDETPVRSAEGLAHGEQRAMPTGRILSYFARAANVGAVMGPEVVPAEPIPDDDDLRERAEEPLKAVAAGSPAVVLGRAGAIVLAQRQRAYHVRLDGPVERRIAWAGPYEGLDREGAAKRQAETDRARSQFVKKLYRADPADASLYHLVMDPTVLGVAAAVDVIKLAAEAFFGREDYSVP